MNQVHYSMLKKITVGLTLSGGGLKGIAHIGVIKALLENNIVPEIISGTSAGAIVGTAYAAGYGPDEMEEIIANISLLKMFSNIGLPKAGFIKMDYLQQRVLSIVPQDTFESLKMPFYVCTTNLNTGRADIYSTGKLSDKIMASCAVPWLFKPVEIDGEVHIDGGIMNNMPALIIRDKCDVLIGSNVKPKLMIASNKELQTFKGLTQRFVDLSLWMSTKPNLKCLDVYIAPQKLVDLGYFEIGKSKYIIELGYEETMLKMDAIKTSIKKAEALQEMSTLEKSPHFGL